MAARAAGRQHIPVLALKEELDRDGIVSKVRLDQHGRRTGGRPLARGALYLMLQNRIYRGEIVHKENCYPGEHKPIATTSRRGSSEAAGCRAQKPDP